MTDLLDDFPENDKRDRVALVVQRMHPDIAGGAEHLASRYAELLREKYRLDVLTTTALNPDTWENELQPGAHLDGGIRVLRFSVSSGRTGYFFKLHNLLMARWRAYRAEPADPRRLHASFFDPDPARRDALQPGEPVFNWTTALQEEWIRSQGPHSRDLLEYLENRGDRYRAILFVTYLYSPTYFGTFLTPRERTFLIPTLHDEAPAYLPVFRRMARRAGFIFWLTPGEQATGEKLWGKLPGRLASFGIDTRLDDSSETLTTDRGAIAPFLQADAPSFLYYCGRIDAGKGCADLIENFRRFRDEHLEAMKLVLTGSLSMELPRDPDIIYGGFVSDEEKFRLMHRCSVFVMPSPNESLSIVTLEAMARRKPVLVNGASIVLRGHVGENERGHVYASTDDFVAALKGLLKDQQSAKLMGEKAREYVLEHFDQEVVRERLIEEIEKAPPL